MMDTLTKINEDHRKSAASYDVFRVAVWQRKPSERYQVVGYARRKPGPLLALWRALVGVFK